jgi:hypothetical protein
VCRDVCGGSGEKASEPPKFDDPLITGLACRILPCSLLHSNPTEMKRKHPSRRFGKDAILSCYDIVADISGPALH